MISEFVKYTFYIILGIVVIFFMLANLNLIKPDSITIPSQGQPAKQYQAGSGLDQSQIEKELVEYSQHIFNQTQKHGQGLVQDIKKQFQFKQKHVTETDSAKMGILNQALKYLAPVSQSQSKAPELEHFDDYAPTGVPMGNSQQILPQTRIDPNYLDLNKSVEPFTGPQPVNEFDTDQNPDFKSERTVPYDDKMPANSINNFFKNNPAKFFDNLAKSDVADPAHWDQISKMKEKNSPLLGLSCMQPTLEGFMPSNHYNGEYSNLV